METKDKKTKDSTSSKKKADEVVKFKGKYTKAIGRRKTAAAQVRLYKGQGTIVVNNMKPVDYFGVEYANIPQQVLKLTGQQKEYDISILVKGGGKKAQAEAIRHGISRALVAINEEFRAVIKAKGWMTRDARKKERKKPGLKKARRAPQWSKR